MKVMDVDMNDQDCTIELVTPSKKKLKQGRLPFKTLSSVESTNTVSNKKRKLNSPSTTRSPKVVKITTKENSKKDVTNDIREIEYDDIHIIESKSEEKEDEAVSDKDTKASFSKLAEKKQIKQRPLTKFLQKTYKKQDSNTEELANTENKSENNENTEKPMEMEDLVSKSNEEQSNENDKARVNEFEKLDLKDKSSDTQKENGIDDNTSKNSDTDSDTPSLSSEDEEEDEEEVNEKSDDESDEKDKLNDSLTSKDAMKCAVVKVKKLTPRQIEKHLASVKRRERMQHLKMEKEKKRLEERESRKREKQLKRKEREEKERAEKEQKRKEKEQKELKRQIEIEQKQKEKEAKEEDRRKREEAKEEERKRKEEERLEAERKKQKAASNFASFFVAKKQENKSAEEEHIKIQNFMPFEIKADMRIAPLCRRNLSESEKSELDKVCAGESVRCQLYLEEIKSGSRAIRTFGRTWPAESKDDVILIDDDEEDNSNVIDQKNSSVSLGRAKLLMFRENRRPAYRGTWRKKSESITARRPFAKDTKWFDYDIDSDDEWEEEEPGESLKGSDDEKDEENTDDNEYDVDNEFMVPHGYLSDEEAQPDEEETEDMSPETQKVKLKILGEQFEEERKTKTARIKPKVIGCIWQGPLHEFPESTIEYLKQFLSDRQAWIREIPITLCAPKETENQNVQDIGTPSRSEKGSSKKTRVPNEAIPDLIRLVHGNTHARRFLVKEFIAFWSKQGEANDSQLSKISVLRKINEIGKWIACPEEGPMYLKNCWYVSEEIRSRYGSEAAIPNRWTYIFPPKRKSEVAVDVVERIEKDDKEKDKDKEKEKDKEKKRIPLITAFTKKMTQEEMQKQLSTKKLTPAHSKPPKRVPLISVGRGEQFPKSSRINLFPKTSKNLDNCENSDDEIMIIESVADVNCISEGNNENPESEEKDSYKDKPENVTTTESPT
ncbi:chromatin assembly factor 1 subunit A [Cephus cinctus]|uniref:Chromatin assembly factor 1 subunit A n=1 Tax=Cephus cinctus TaxID=211228 RepID=A0AAJ7FNQ6_CEPCN|nr:chromatin assembly factor 1 subunit A [Cephus cinctus]XP_024943502.1 chromatin assembly factor 1 subunit A [Cephus cinctus]